MCGQTSLDLNNLDDQDNGVPGAMCSNKCPGNNSKWCGGQQFVSLYKTTNSRRRRESGENDSSNNRKSKKEKKGVEKKPENERPVERSTIELAFDPLLKPIADIIKKQSLAETRQMFQRLNNTVARQNLFEILWYTQLPCFDVRDTTSIKYQQYSMFKSCYWMGSKLPCSEIFKTVSTDVGMFCNTILQI